MSNSLNKKKKITVPKTPVISDTRHHSYVMLMLVSIAPLLYYSCIIVYSVNVPVGDDYSMLGFYNKFQALSSLVSKMELLFSFHNEHRIVTTRVVMLLSAMLTDSIDFRVLGLIGNGALFVALIVIGRMLHFRAKIEWALLFLIVLQPQSLKLMFYPMASMQAYFGLLFSFLYLYYALNERSWLSLSYYVITILTTGSGIFLSLLGIPILLYKKKYKGASIHAAVTILTVLLYSPCSANLTYLLEHPLTVAIFFLLLLGSVAQLPLLGNPFLQVGFSMVLLGYFAFFVWKGYRQTSSWLRREDLATSIALLYLLMIIGLIAIGRTSIYEEDLWRASIDGRYRIYSIIFFAICCINFLGNLSIRERFSSRLSVLMVALAFAFNLSWYAYSITEMRSFSQSETYAMNYWLSTRSISELPIGACPPDEAEINLNTAVKAGVFRP